MSLFCHKKPFLLPLPRACMFVYIVLGGLCHIFAGHLVLEHLNLASVKLFCNIFFFEIISIYVPTLSANRVASVGPDHADQTTLLHFPVNLHDRHKSIPDNLFQPLSRLSIRAVHRIMKEIIN